MAAKEALIIILDVGESMGELRGSSSETSLDKAKHAFRLIVEQKLLFGYAQDQIGVVLFNTKDTTNSLFEQYGDGDDENGQYSHISVYWEMQKPTIQLLEAIDDITVESLNDNKKKKKKDGDNGETVSADILDAILVGAQLIHDTVGTKKFKKRIFMLTDATSKLTEQDQTDAIAASFNDQNIEFYCLGIGFGDEKERDDDDDDDNDGDNDNDEIEIEGGDPNRPQCSIENEKRLRRFVKKIPKGVVYSAKEAISMLSGLRTKSVLNRATYTDTLEITSELCIDVQLYTRCREQTLPSLKKQSTKSSEEGPKAQGVMMERIYRNKFNKNEKENENDIGMSNNLDIFGGSGDGSGGGGGYGGGDGGADFDFDFDFDNNNNDNNGGKDNNNNNNEDNIVDEDSRIKSYLYGKQRIPFTERDLSKLEYKSGAKHFRLIGFINKNQLKREQFMGPCYICVANQKTNETDSPNELGLSAFIHGCYEKNVVGVARLVVRKNAPPKFVCLIPRIKASHECFIVNELPFYEDIRHFPFAGFKQNKKYQPNKEQLKCMENFVNTLDLMKAGYESGGDEEDGDDDDVVEALKPQNTFNPILQRFYDNLQARAIVEDCQLIELNEIVAKYLEPPSSLFMKAEKIINDMKGLFPTKVIPKKDVKNQRAHWNDFDSDLMEGLIFDSTQDNASSVAQSNANNNNNDNKDDDNDDEEDNGGGEVDLGAMLDVNQVKKIGTQNPILDFDNLLSKRSSADLFKKLSKEFINIIYELIDTSYQELNYDKAINCLAHLRKQCILEEEPILFNNYIKDVKNKYENRKKSLWKKIVQYKKGKIRLTLLSNDDFEEEIDGLNVSKQEQVSFLEEKKKEKEINVKQSSGDSDDDDLDDLI